MRRGPASAIDVANQPPAASTNHMVDACMRKRYTRVQNSAAQTSDQETSRAHQNDKRRLVSLKETNEQNTHKHTFTQ